MWGISWGEGRQNVAPVCSGPRAACGQHDHSQTLSLTPLPSPTPRLVCRLWTTPGHHTNPVPTPAVSALSILAGISTLQAMRQPTIACGITRRSAPTIQGTRWGSTFGDGVKWGGSALMMYSRIRSFHYNQEAVSLLVLAKRPSLDA